MLGRKVKENRKIRENTEKSRKEQKKQKTHIKRRVRKNPKALYSFYHSPRYGRSENMLPQA
jgi:hypothetical protein